MATGPWEEYTTTEERPPWEEYGAAAPAPPPPAAPPVPANGTNALIPMGPGENRAPTPRAPGGLKNTIVGAVETALEMAAQMTGGYFDAVRAGGRADQQGTAGADLVRSGLKYNLVTGPLVAALERAGGGQGQQMSPRGREMTETVGGAMANLPPMLGVHGTLAGPVAGGNVGVAARQIKDAAHEATFPILQPTKAAKLAAPENAGIVKAREAGYLLTPKAGRAGAFSRAMQKASGSEQLSKEMAARNAENTSRLAQADVGLPEDVPPTREATASIRKEAGQDYAAVRDVGRIKFDEQLAKDLDTIVEPFVEGGKDFDQLAKNPIIKTVEGLRKTEAETGSVIEIVKDLRNESDKAFRAGDKKLGSSYRAAATALDNAMDRALTAMSKKGPPELAQAVDKYRAARKRIAKTYLLDDAMDGKPGEVNAMVYGRALKKGVPLDGEALKIAEFANQFGEEGLARKLGKTSDAGPGYGDILLAALHAPSSIVGAVAGLVGRPAARAVLKSERMQKRIAEGAKRSLARAGADAAEPKAPELALQEYVRRPEGEAPAAGPLGDLTPDWETAPGVNAGRGMPVEEPGLTPPIDEAPPNARLVTGAPVPELEGPPRGGVPLREAMPRGGTQTEIPAVPGRPDLPDTMVAGGPAEVSGGRPRYEAATLDAGGTLPQEPARGQPYTDRAGSSGAAMQTPEAELARRQQGAQRADALAAQERAEPVPMGEATEIRPEVVEPAPTVAAEQMHPEVAKIAEQVTKAREKRKQAETAASELRRAAAATTDAELAAALRKRADAIAKEEKLPVGEVKEGQPEIKTSVPKKIPTGKATEVFDAPDQEPKQGSVQQERVQGNEGGQAAEAGAGDRVQRPAEGAGKAPGEESLSIDLPSIDEGFMDAQQRAQEAKAPPPSPRGRRQTRAALERGMADGTLDRDGAALALWALDRNPNLARGLRTEVTAGTEKSAKGSYNSAERIVKLFQGNTNPQTAVHEILHHSERMMPPEVQQGIRRAWERALKAEMEGASPEKRAAFEALQRAAGGDAEALATVKQAFKDGTLVKDHYQLTNPTEFWAVNGARILHERFTGRGSWRAEAIRWLKDMVEHVKATVGVRSDSAILKALEEVLDATKNKGTDRSPGMIKSKKE